MKTHPMLFSGPMIRALLEGRKVQTRRIIKKQPGDFQGVPTGCKTVADYCTGSPEQGLAYYWRGAGGSWNSSPPFFVKIKVGDLIWVRESWSGEYVFGNIPPSQRKPLDTGHGTFAFPANIHYWADGEPKFGDWERGRPSIHMPRWASRITLEVTDVRVQRLKDISREDCVAESCNGWVAHDGEDGLTPEEEFQDLWNSINGPDAWDQNPWVVAYSFTVHQCNVDQIGEAS